MRNLFPKTFLVTWIAIGALCAGPLHAQVVGFVQVNLVSDIPGVATITDPQLVNPWGVSHSSTSPFWTSNQGKNTATLYTVTDRTTITKVNINPPAGFVMIPTTATGTASGVQGPTGQVNNSNSSATGCDVSGGIAFPVKNGGDGGFAHFIFANLNGTISAWDTGTTAFIQATAASGTVYTGLAINGAQTRLYAANNAGTGSIDVYDCTFTPVSLGDDAFVNPALPDGLVPFNVQEIGGNVYVAYAPAGRPAQQNAPLGAGAVAIFDEDGNFITQLITGSRLAAPWGMTLASAGFGRFINHLLVGNFSYLHSEINAFDPTTGKLRGTIPIVVGKGRTPGGLWSIGFGVGGSNGDPNTLYFSDGINGENDGLFGAIFANGNGS
jgi:uncharacterized protein (TIGR03118 family)